MLNEIQQSLFLEVLDYSWESKQEQTNLSKRLELINKMNEAKEKLRKSMGDKAYNDFFEAGHKLFAPIKDSRRTSSDEDEFID